MKEQITQNSRRVASVITAHTRTWVTWFLRIHRDEYHAAPVFARILTVVVALFLGFCTSVGPIYRANLSLSVFGFGNALTFLIASLIYWSLIIVATALIRYRTHLAILASPIVGSAFSLSPALLLQIISPLHRLLPPLPPLRQPQLRTLL